MNEVMTHKVEPQLPHKP